MLHLGGVCAVHNFMAGDGIHMHYRKEKGAGLVNIAVACHARILGFIPRSRDPGFRETKCFISVHS